MSLEVSSINSNFMLLSVLFTISSRYDFHSVVTSEVMTAFLIVGSPSIVSAAFSSSYLSTATTTATTTSRTRMDGQMLMGYLNLMVYWSFQTKIEYPYQRLSITCSTLQIYTAHVLRLALDILL